MAFKFKLTFHGIVALVPTTDKGTMRVLLGRFRPVPGVKDQIAYVRYEDGTLRSPGSRKTGAPPKNVPKQNENQRHVVLDGEYLTLVAKIDPKDDKLQVNMKKDPDSDTPTAIDRFSLVWVPEVEKIMPGAGQIEPALLAKPVTVKPGIAARIDLVHGRLATTGADDVQVPFGPPGQPPVLTQAVAREIQLELDILDDSITFKSEPLDAPNGGRPKAAGDLVFEKPKGATTMAIVIGNEPEEDIYQLMEPIQAGPSTANDAALEFSLLYQLSKNHPPKGNVPQAPGRRPSGQVCIGGRYADTGTTGGK